MNFLAGLNEEQKEAVLTPYQHVRIIAGAGSGKTRVLTTRIAHLVLDKGYLPRKICAITFTNKAANEMKTRLESMLPSTEAAQVSTIHSLCVQIIRFEYEALGLVRNFTIIDQDDQKTILKEAYREYGYERKELNHNEVLTYISNNKIANVSVEHAYKLAGSSFYEQKKAKVYDYYVKRLDELFALDFDDLLLKVDQLFKTNKKVLEKWQHRYDVILVDEFQDVDHIQYSIIDSLVGTENELYVVGDPDQTIYTWRGADMSFIIDFDKQYPSSITITLNQNYRSTQNILNSANELIKFNKNRLEKNLVSNKDTGEDVVYGELDDETDEAYWIARKISGLHNQGVKYLDMAILYRSNYLSRNIEKVLMNLQIPYIIYGGLRFYDRQEIKDVMSYLRMVSHGDDLALRRSVGVPKRGIGTVTLDKIFDEANATDRTMYQVMYDSVQAGKGGAKIASYVELIESFKEFHENHGSIERLIQRIIEDSGIRKMHEKNEDLERLENIKSLMGEALEYQKNNEEGTLEEYVQMVSLYGDREEVLDTDYVRLMTIHAAKGLEFDTVFLMGMNDDVFPNKNSILDSKHGMSEERRLAYVAITRAEHRLFVTGNRGYSYVMDKRNRPSRFIQEMDHDGFKYEVQGVLQNTTAHTRALENHGHPNVRQGKVKLKPTDIVVHDDFGEGIVISVDDMTVKIAFNYPFGTKVISRNYSGLRLKGDLT